MKKLLAVSVLLNLLLMACLFAVLKQPASDASMTEAPVQEEVASNDTGASISHRAEAGQEPPAPSQFSPSTFLPARNHSLERRVTMPLVFQEVDLTQLNLNPDQFQAIDDLRQRFLVEIGGLDQDLSAPAYLERWQKSQPDIDDALRAMIGVTAFQDYQIKAERSR